MSRIRSHRRKLLIVVATSLLLMVVWSVSVFWSIEFHLLPQAGAALQRGRLIASYFEGEAMDVVSYAQWSGWPTIRTHDLSSDYVDWGRLARTGWSFERWGFVPPAVIPAERVYSSDEKFVFGVFFMGPMPAAPPEWPLPNNEERGKGPSDVIAYSVRLPLWVPGLVCLLWLGYLLGRGGRYQSGQCQDCGYNLRGNVSGVCPECGERVAPAAAADHVQGDQSRKA